MITKRLQEQGLSMLTSILMTKGEEVVKNLIFSNTGVDITNQDSVDKGVEKLKDLDMQLLLEEPITGVAKNTKDTSSVADTMKPIEDIPTRIRPSKVSAITARTQAKTKVQYSAVLSMFLPIFSIILTLAILIALVTQPSMDAGVREVLKAVLITVVSFWFGSSLGSKQKTEQGNVSKQEA